MNLYLFIFLRKFVKKKKKDSHLPKTISMKNNLAELEMYWSPNDIFMMNIFLIFNKHFSSIYMCIL